MSHNHAGVVGSPQLLCRGCPIPIRTEVPVEGWLQPPPPPNTYNFPSLITVPETFLGFSNINLMGPFQDLGQPLPSGKQASTHRLEGCARSRADRKEPRNVAINTTHNSSHSQVQSHHQADPPSSWHPLLPWHLPIISHIPPPPTTLDAPLECYILWAHQDKFNRH